MFSSKDKLFMERAFELAEESFDDEEVPVGAVIVKDGKIIGEGKNKVISKNDVTSHAEINALRDASKNTNNYRLNACLMYVTLEPCHMCAKAAIDARISSIVFAAKEPKTGSIVSIDNFLDKKIFNHNVTYRFGLMETRSSKLLKKFTLAQILLMAIQCIKFLPIFLMVRPPLLMDLKWKILNCTQNYMKCG